MSSDDKQGIRPYQAPELRVIGTLSELTQGITGLLGTDTLGVSAV